MSTCIWCNCLPSLTLPSPSAFLSALPFSGCWIIRELSRGAFGMAHLWEHQAPIYCLLGGFKFLLNNQKISSCYYTNLSAISILFLNSCPHYLQPKECAEKEEGERYLLVIDACGKWVFMVYSQCQKKSSFLWCITNQTQALKTYICLLPRSLQPGKLRIHVSLNINNIVAIFLIACLLLLNQPNPYDSPKVPLHLTTVFIACFLFHS